MNVRLWTSIAIVLILTGCSAKPEATKDGARSSSPPTPSLALKALHPNATPIGIKFNVQPNGVSAIAVECENATKDTVILFDNSALTTVFGNGTLLTAEVPEEYYSKPRVIAVSLKGPGGQSASLPFAVQ